MRWQGFILVTKSVSQSTLKTFPFGPSNHRQLRQCTLDRQKVAQQSVPHDHWDKYAPDPRQLTPGLAWWESAHALRAVRQFAWLEADSGKLAMSRPVHQRVTRAVRRFYVDTIVLYLYNFKNDLYTFSNC